MFRDHNEIAAFITNADDAELEGYRSIDGKNILQELIEKFADPELFFKLLSLPSLKFKLANSPHQAVYLRALLNNNDKFIELLKKRSTDEEKLEFLKCFIGRNLVNSDLGDEGNLSDEEKKNLLKQIILASNIFDFGSNVHQNEFSSRTIFKALIGHLRFPSPQLLSGAIIEIAKEESSHEDNPVIVKFFNYEYFRSIDSREKENIDAISNKLLNKFSSKIGHKNDLRMLGDVSKIAGNIYMHKERYRKITLSSVPGIEKNMSDVLVDVKGVIINPRMYIAFLKDLNGEMVDVLKKDGTYEEYLKYERESQDRKSYVQVGNTQFVLNPARFEHWNHALRRVLSQQLAKHGINLVDENGYYKVFYGFVDKKAADDVVKDGNIFTDNLFPQGGLIHGKYTHAIQLYLLTKAIESGQLKLPDGLSFKDLVSFIVTTGIWGGTLDSNSANLDPAINSDFEFCLDDTRLVYTKLAVLGEVDKNLSCLGNCLSNKFHDGLVKICEYMELSGAPLTREQVLLYQVARGNAFNAVESFLTPEQYYLWRDDKRIKEGKAAKYTNFNQDGQPVLDEMVIKIESGGIVIKKAVIAPSKILESPVATAANNESVACSALEI